MKISRIRAYRVDLPLHEGSYKWSGGKSVTVFDSTVVAGRHRRRRSPATARSVRSGRSICRPTPTASAPASPSWGRTCSARTRCELQKLNRRMDAALKGHPYVKSGIDMACWDILGKATGQPVCTLLGGRYGDDFGLYRAISQESPEAMAGRVAGYRAEGYRRFQLKVGGDPAVDIERIRAVAAKLQPGDRLIADANTGWLMHDAMRVVRAVRDVDVYIEQPCLSYEECLSIRRHTDHPFVLDEVIDSVDVLLRGHADRAMDVVNIKISKFGGLTKARQARDLCVVAGRRHDAGGQLGRRHRHGRHRPPGPQHAAGVPVHGHRLQQLRHRQHRRRGAAAGQRPHGRVHGARPGHHAAQGRAGRGGAGGVVTLGRGIRIRCHKGGETPPLRPVSPSRYRGGGVSPPSAVPD